MSWCPVPGARYPVPGARCPVSGARCPVPGARCPCPVPGRRGLTTTNWGGLQPTGADYNYKLFKPDVSQRFFSPSLAPPKLGRTTTAAPQGSRTKTFAQVSQTHILARIFAKILPNPQTPFVATFMDLGHASWRSSVRERDICV